MPQRNCRILFGSAKIDRRPWLEGAAPDPTVYAFILQLCQCRYLRVPAPELWAHSAGDVARRADVTSTSSSACASSFATYPAQHVAAQQGGRSPGIRLIDARPRPTWQGPPSRIVSSPQPFGHMPGAGWADRHVVKGRSATRPPPVAGSSSAPWCAGTRRVINCLARSDTAQHIVAGPAVPGSKGLARRPPSGAYLR
jgi:hypothetical protein